MSFIDFFKRKPTSSNVAKDRLKLVLVSDRANCSPELMEQIKNDIINVLSKYLEIDLEGLDIKISQTEIDADNGAVPALFANIPIKDMKAKSENQSDNKTKSAEMKGSNNTKNRNSKNKSNNIKKTIITTGSKDKIKV